MTTQLKKATGIIMSVVAVLFLWVTPVFAQTDGGLVTLNANNETIGKALEQLTKNYGYTFVIPSGEIDTQRVVRIKVKNRNIHDVLRQLFKNQ